MALKPVHRGDTWTFDLEAQGLAPLAGGPAPAFDLSGCIVELALAPSGGAAILTERYQIPASANAALGLARITVPPSLSDGVPAGGYKLQMRAVSPSAVPFVATQAFETLKVLPTLLPPVTTL